VKIASLATAPVAYQARSSSPAALDTRASGSQDPFAAQQAQLKALRSQLAAPSLDSKLDTLFAQARTSPNPVLASTEPVIRNAQHIKLNHGKLQEAAKALTAEQIKPCDWHLPNYIQGDNENTINFMFLMNSINFLFFDPNTGDKFQTEYKGQTWKGSEGMVASLTRALDEGIPVLDPKFLANVTEAEMKHIFRGTPELPLLKERTEIFNEVGQVLQEKYAGSFANLLQAANHRAFDNGNGIVERLTRDFPSFRDSSGDVQFNKRAQLVVGMLASRLEGTGLFDCPDLQELTVFADYQLPRGLRALGVLEYGPELAATVDNGVQIPKDSQLEKELRAFTVVASKLLQDEVNARPGMNADARGLDSYLWWSARQDKNSRPHVTVTTAY